jgi:hypothetical protein
MSKLGGASALLALGFCAAAACGGQVVGQDSGASCTVPGGTYVEHFTSQTALCTPIPDQSYSLAGPTTFAVADAGPGAPEPGCTASVDGASCTVSYACAQTNSGYDIQSNMTLVYKSDGTATGTLVRNLTDAGGTKTTCTYDVTVTKS